MPKLPTFSAGGGDAPAFGGRRAEAGDFDRTGAGLVQAGRQIQGAATELMSEFEQQEARKALVGSTEIRARYNRRLDEAAINGEDTDKIKQEMLTELSKIGDEFQTKRGADSLQIYTANNEITFDQEAVRIKTVRAGAEAKLQGHKFLNDAGANVQRDPTRLKQEEAAAEALAETFTRLPKEQRALIADGLKKDLNMAAAMALVRDQPAETKKRLEGGEFDLTPEQRTTAINKAETEERARRADAAYQRAEKEREKQEQNDAARDTHFASIMKGTASQRQIMDDSRLTPATREHMIALMEARAKAGAAAEKRSDPAVKKALWMRINAPEGDPNKMYSADAIFAEVKAGRINTTDADYLNNQMAAQRDVNGSRFGQRLNQRMSVIGRAMNDSPEFKAQPELAAAIQNSLIAQVEQKSAEMRKANKSPDDLLNPDSPEYFFKPGLLKATAAAVKQQQLNEAMQGIVNLRTAPDAWKDVKVGERFVDPNGTIRTMTPALKTALEKQGAKKAAVFATSGEKWPHDLPMSLDTYRYRTAAGLSVNKGLTVIDANGRRVPDSEL